MYPGKSEFSGMESDKELLSPRHSNRAMELWRLRAQERSTQASRVRVWPAYPETKKIKSETWTNPIQETDQCLRELPLRTPKKMRNETDYMISLKKKRKWNRMGRWKCFGDRTVHLKWWNGKILLYVYLSTHLKIFF
jgi:hypothetical protein